MPRPLRSTPARAALTAALALTLAGCSGGGSSAPTPHAVDPNDLDGDGVPNAVDNCPAIANADQADGDLDGMGDACDTCPTLSNPGGAACPAEVRCAALPATADPCTVTTGTAGLVVSGDVLVPGTIYRGGSVAIDAGGTITCVGCGCAATAASATRVSCPRAVISAGLVDAHAHLSYGATAPLPDTGGERYDRRNEWRLGLDGHTRIAVSGSTAEGQVALAELRGILAGTTSVVGDAAAAAGLQRNLSSAARLEGLAHATAYVNGFPLGATPPASASGCAGFTIVDPSAWTSASAAMLHVGEGIDAWARGEFLCASSTTGGGRDLLGPATSLVNAIGLTAADWATATVRHARLVWSPRSNVRLYGDTARVTVADRLGVRIALGTDWLPTGSMNLLRELRCADAWNRERLKGHFGDEALWLMATRNAAEAAGFGDALGVLAVGKAGDLAVFDARARRDHRAVLAADPQDVLLVVRGGRALYGDAATVTGILGAGAGCEAVDVCGAAKAVCVSHEAVASYATLVAGAAYPPFFCDTPAGEPTCVPSRPPSAGGGAAYTGATTAEDPDGDGVPSATDRCAGVFDPAWPLDDGAQADLDGDGLGDVCDPCPLGTAATCSPPAAGDVDGDGIPDASDDCPLVPNADQADADTDGMGDACDPCPTQPNRGTACRVSVYDVKNGTARPGAVVAVGDAVVTATGPGGFFMQVPPGAAYAGADFSGVWVAAGDGAASVGDVIALAAAQVTSWFGEIQLVPSSAPTVVASGQPLPAPTGVAPADVATGGSRAAALEGVLVQVQDVTVVDVAPPLGPGDTAPSNEFVVTGGLRVDDLLALADPFPSVGTGYATLTGVLAYRNEASKLEPRSAADATPSIAALSAFGPAASFARVGASSAPTFPTPLTVTLASPVPTSTFVPVTSSSAALAVAGGGVTVPAGETSAAVQVSGIAPELVATLTASLGATALTASVRVLGATEEPATVALTPAAVAVAPGGSRSFTVALDLPAPATGTLVALALAPPGAGTIPASVMVPPGALSATFSYVDAAAAASATITATLGGSTASATVTVAGTAGLVLNEIDYDSVGVDSMEFIEVYNAGGVAVSLAAVSLVFVNGANGQEYGRLGLAAAGSLAPGQCLVAGTAALLATVGDGPAKVTLPLAQDNLQNGAPDGVLLLDTGTGTVLDALSYEGAITAATVTGVTGTVSLVEGTAVQVQDSPSVAGSLCRSPNGVDTNDAATDWKLCATPTPGGPNP